MSVLNRGRRSRAAFTLIELLVVVAIVAILVVLSFVRLSSSRGRAIEAAMMNDLRNVRTAQEVHVGRTGSYAGDLATIGLAPSAGVTLVITEASASGWAATAEHPGGRATRCALFAGSVSAPPPPATEENVIVCE